MSKSNDNGRPRRSRNFKPYDANDSLIKKITQRVTDIIPRPSWVTRWMGSDHSNADPRIDSSEEDEEDSGGGGTIATTTTAATTTPIPALPSRPPPSKRICLPSVSVNSTTNHVQRHGDLGDRHPGEISPILPSALAVSGKDRAEAGPSGLQRFRLDSKFVSSTPALQESKPRDNFSESSESTSGCSSLIPQGERRGSVVEGSSSRRIAAEPRRLNITPTSSNNTSLGSRNLTMKLKRQGSLSSSFSTPKPSFDTSVFNSPLSRCSNSLNEGSPFHRGRTLYGGASGYRRALDGTLVSPLTMAEAATSTSRIAPKVVSVRPSVSNVTGSHVSSSAMRIFKALEQFSSPVQDTKKIPLKADSERRKRKAIRPFEELVLPEMPDLLRIKRKEVEPSSKKTPVSTPSTASYQLPPPIQQLPLSSASDKRHAGGALRKSSDIEFEKVAEVNLPKVDLPITTLPKFSFCLQKEPAALQSPQQNTTTGQSAAPSTTTTPATTTPISRFKSLPSMPTSASKVPPSSPARTAQFRFSNALDVEKSGPPNKLPSSDLKFTFCEPAPAIPKNGTTTIASTVNFNSIVFKPSTPSSLATTSPSSFPTAKLKSRTKKEESETSPTILKTAPDVTAGSIDDFFKKSTTSALPSADLTKNVTAPATKPSIPSENGDLSAFKPKSDTWECKECFVRNVLSRDKCEACGTAKSSVTLKTAPPVVQPVKSGSEPTLNALFKKPEGSWECKECFVSNKADSASCVACGTNKSGTAAAATSKPLGGGFQFGIPPTASANACEKKPFTFGVTSPKDPVQNDATVQPASIPQSGFTFGVVKPQENDVGVAKSPSTDSSDECLKSKKRVSFSEPPAMPFEERSMSVEESLLTPATEPVVPPPSAEGEKKASTAFLFSSGGATAIGKMSSFAPSSSTDSPASSAVSSSMFKFGGSSTGVSSSTDAAEPEKKGGFTFTSNQTGASSVPATTAPTSAAWGAPISSKVTFGAPVFPPKVEPTNNGASSTSETRGALVLGAKRENPFGSVFGTEKKSLFDSAGAHQNQSNFNSNDESKTKPLFNSVVNSAPLFGANQQQVPSSAAQPKPFTFGAASPFSFKAPATENKPSAGAFTFGSSNVSAPPPSLSKINSSATAATDGPSGGNLFGISAFSQDATGSVAPVTQTPSSDLTAGAFCSGGIFNRTTGKSPMFGGSPAAPSAAPTPFTFGASATASPLEQQQAVPSNPMQSAPQAQSLFSCPPQLQPSNVQPSPFTFGAAQNSVPIHQQLPVQPPSFDPNIKPNFNFSGGSTPTFSAIPTGNASELRLASDRKIRRAVRRTTQPR